MENQIALALIPISIIGLIFIIYIWWKDSE